MRSSYTHVWDFTLVTYDVIRKRGPRIRACDGSAHQETLKKLIRRQQKRKSARDKNDVRSCSLDEDEKRKGRRRLRGRGQSLALEPAGSDRGASGKLGKPGAVTVATERFYI